MWPELVLIYLFGLQAKGYRPGDPIGAGIYGSLVIDMAQRPPAYLTGQLISPENMVKIALARMQERINDEDNKRNI